MKGVQKDEFRKRVIGGKKLDLSVENKEADERAFGIFVATMPSVNTLKRVKNLLVHEEQEVLNASNVFPLYLHVEEADAGYSLGQIEVTIETYTRLSSMLEATDAEFAWVYDGVRSVNVTRDDLIGTIRFKRGLTIHEVV